MQPSAATIDLFYDSLRIYFTQYVYRYIPQYVVIASLIPIVHLDSELCNF